MYQRLIYLYCDHPDCSDAPPFTIDPDPGETATEQRAEARREGWTRSDGKDLCKEHG